VRKALDAGKSVVTANKKLIAYHGVELERLAAAKGGHLKYGAAVAGGIPVIPGLEQGLAGDRIERIEGILNGTCNFILSKMEEGAEYATVLAEAQAKGYAEADPTEDVGGFDARAKLAILMRLALRVEVDPEEIVPRPITRLRPWTSAMRATWAAPSARWRGPSRTGGRWRPRWDRCWWICIRRWPGRGARRTW
jgi:homoserine dehydrogenase